MEFVLLICGCRFVSMKRLNPLNPSVSHRNGCFHAQPSGARTYPQQSQALWGNEMFMPNTPDERWKERLNPWRIDNCGRLEYVLKYLFLCCPSSSEPMFWSGLLQVFLASYTRVQFVRAMVAQFEQVGVYCPCGIEVSRTWIISGKPGSRVVWRRPLRKICNSQTLHS